MPLFANGEGRFFEECEQMKFISWNVNGIRACLGKGFLDFLKAWMRIFSVFKKQNAKQGRLN